MIRITRLITILAVTMGVMFFVLGAAIAHLSPLEGSLFALGIIVANVPEGLLPEVSLTLAMSARRMAVRKAIVKRLERVETLGAVTVIVTDKTGTLTENQMTVREAWLPSANWQFEGSGYEPSGRVSSIDSVTEDFHNLEHLLRCAALCCDARLKPPSAAKCKWTVVGDPTEAAIVVAAAKFGISEDRLREYPRLAELPFDSVRKRMTTIQADGTAAFVCIKGALEEVISRCTASMGDGRTQRSWPPTFRQSTKLPIA